jgi:hypothetical protein
VIVLAGVAAHRKKSYHTSPWWACTKGVGLSLRGRKKKLVGCIIDGETMEVQHKSYRSEGARIKGIGVCLCWFWASRTVVYIA